MAWYRNVALPRAARNFPIVTPVMAGLWLPLLLGVGPALLGVDMGNYFSDSMITTMLVVGGSYFFFSLVVVDLLLFKPPSVLVPSWLREDDARVGYRQRTADWVDLIILLGGAPFLVFGLVMLSNL